MVLVKNRKSKIVNAQTHFLRAFFLTIFLKVIAYFRIENIIMTCKMSAYVKMVPKIFCDSIYGSVYE